MGKGETQVDGIGGKHRQYIQNIYDTMQYVVKKTREYRNNNYYYSGSVKVHI